MKKLLICLIALCSSQAAFAQVNVNGSSANPVPDFVTRNEMIRAEIDRSVGKDANGMIADRKIPPPARVPIYKDKKAENEARREDSKRAAKMLVPPAGYYTQFDAFLREKNTGLARIFSDKECGGKQLEISVTEIEKCADLPPITGNGSFYSFPLSAAGRFRVADLHFINGMFQAGGLNMQGIISEIGNSKIEDISLNAPALEFISNYQLKNTSEEIKREAAIFKKGITSNSFVYSISAAAVPGHTYVLRSIGFRIKNDIMRTDQTDLTVVFKIVGQEPDGSLILLWKELKRSKTKVLKG